MGTFEGRPHAANRSSDPPAAMFGCRNGEAWVAEDVFVTRCQSGEIMVERWDGQGVRTAIVRKDSAQFMHAELWVKLTDVAVDGVAD